MNLGWFGVPPSGGSNGLNRLKPNAIRKFTCPAACPGGTNGNSPAIHRWVWAGRRLESRRDERRLIPASQVNRSDSVVPAGLCAAAPRTPALKRWAIVTRSLRDKALAEFPKGISANVAELTILS